MSERERAHQLVDLLPEYQLRVLIAYMEQMPSAEEYNDYVEQALDEAEAEAHNTSIRLTSGEVFGKIREKLYGRV